MNVPAEQPKQMPDKKRARITVEDMLRAKAPDLSAMLGPDQSLDRFIAAVANQVVKEPRIASVPLDVTMLEVAKAAKDGLVLDGREATLLFFTTKSGPTVSYVPMVLGLRKMAFRSGIVKALITGVVYEREYLEGHFVYSPTSDEPIIHKPMLIGDRGMIVAAYSFVRMSDGASSAEVMRVDEINAIRARAKPRNFSPWDSDFSEMARKTVFRRHSKQLPLGSGFQAAIEQVDSLYPDDVTDIDPAQSEVVPLKRSAAAKFTDHPEPVPHDAETGEVVEVQTPAADAPKEEKTEEDIF